MTDPFGYSDAMPSSLSNYLVKRKMIYQSNALLPSNHSQLGINKLDKNIVERIYQGREEEDFVTKFAKNEKNRFSSFNPTVQSEPNF